jgi:cytochrome c-type biogenesis protein CcmE
MIIKKSRLSILIYFILVISLGSCITLDSLRKHPIYLINQMSGPEFERWQRHHHSWREYYELGR